ncbi:MAG: FMN-dependent NADH-azoreductase [Gammaproteobacteria bacterium]|nr:FMN-dependent NADH-azoreductase [Gammaproteobacteria bacterium]
MTTVLQINSSMHGKNAQSSRLATEFVQSLLAARQANRPGGNPGDTVIVRDLAKQPVPHLTAERFQALAAPASERTLDQQRVVAESDELIEELQRADVIVIGLPMYNFGVPSALKAYFDHVARAGVTFRYTANGPVGLLNGKKAYVFATRGGRYAGTPADLQTEYVRQFLGFIGIRDVEFVYAEGLALGVEQRIAAVADAVSRIGQLAA